MPTLKDLRFAAARLVLPGELEAVMDEAGRKSDPDAWAKRNAACATVLVRRFTLFMELAEMPEVQAMPVAWLHAAVRIHGEDAAATLRPLVERRDWPGDEIAEEALTWSALLT